MTSLSKERFQWRALLILLAHNGQGNLIGLMMTIPLPKNQDGVDGGARQDNLSGKSDAGAGPSDYHQGRQHKS